MKGAARHLLAVKKNRTPPYPTLPRGPHLHVYSAAHNSGSSGPVSSSGPHRAPIVRPADVSAAPPDHLPIPAGGGGQGREGAGIGAFSIARRGGEPG